MKKSLKYRFLLKVVRLLPAKRIMAASKEKAQKLFRKAYKGENIPELTDPDLNIGQDKINGATVLVYQHKKASDRIGIYLVGGGMLKYPQPGQAKEVAQLAKDCGLDMLLPYYPIVFTGATLPDVYEMLYQVYPSENTRLEEIKKTQNY